MTGIAGIESSSTEPATKPALRHEKCIEVFFTGASINALCGF